MLKLNIEKNMNNKKIKNVNNELLSRKNKLKKLRKTDIAFPNDFSKNYISSQLHYNYGDKTDKELKSLNIKVKIAGRMINRRIMGKASFATIQDIHGKIQIYLVCNNFSNNEYNKHFKKWDLGDIIGIEGILFKTRTNELSINCTKIRLLTKTIRPISNKFHGLVDQEIRYRQRYLDLISNEKSRNIFMMRSYIISKIRKFMIKNDFIEVETPMMQSIPGGASARPFITYHNALDINMYLRISPELYLKRLIIGGFERIFEINRNFRNEGLSPYHNPEFTMMELYIAYSNYNDLILLSENLLNTLVKTIFNSNTIKYGKHILDFSIPFKLMTMKESICHYNPNISLQEIENIESSYNIATKLGIKIEKKWGLGRIQNEIFKITSEHNIIQPTFITEYPSEISPLARRNDKNPFYSDRFELFICGCEIGNGFSELNDPEEQAIQFSKQISEKDIDNEFIFYDNEYITALEYGLPPCAGLGIGIDRLIMFMTNSHNIRDVILFPTLRPKK